MGYSTVNPGKAGRPGKPLPIGTTAGARKIVYVKIGDGTLATTRYGISHSKCNHITTVSHSTFTKDMRTTKPNAGEYCQTCQKKKREARRNKREAETGELSEDKAKKKQEKARLACENDAFALMNRAIARTP